jgi:hypothetical protein
LNAGDPFVAMVWIVFDLFSSISISQSRDATAAGGWAMMAANDLRGQERKIP